MNRRFAPWVKFATLAAGLLAASAPTPASAWDSAATPAPQYKLINTAAADQAPILQALFEVVPAGAVAPISSDVSPLTILASSSGFDQSALQVSLGQGTAPDGTALQALGLDFGPGGFKPGGELDFGLSLAAGTAAPPQLLVLTPSASTLTIGALTSGTDVGTPTPPPATAPSTMPTTNTPEPMSLLIWSGLAGLGLIRARAYRRAHRPIG